MESFVGGVLGVLLSVYVVTSVILLSVILEAKWKCESDNNVNKCYMYYSILPPAH